MKTKFGFYVFPETEIYYSYMLGCLLVTNYMFNPVKAKLNLDKTWEFEELKP